MEGLCDKLYSGSGDLNAELAKVLGQETKGKMSIMESSPYLRLVWASIYIDLEKSMLPRFGERGGFLVSNSRG